MHIRLKVLIATLGVSALCVTILAAAHSPFPSDAAMRTRFFAHHTDFERLVAMANEDSHLTRIAPKFTWLENDVAWPRKNAGISKQRWNEYRRLFRRLGASEGILENTDPRRIFFPITSAGLVPGGCEKGFVYSKEPLTPVLKSLDGRIPNKYWNGPDHSHVLVYKPIAPHWYSYYEQW